MNFSDKLDELIRQSCEEIDALPQMQAMLSGSLSKDQYIGFLLKLYPVVSNFCPMMACAAGWCADRYDIIRRYLYDHIFEERDHEHLVLNDLRAFDVDVSGVPSRMPESPVQAMLAYNYHYASTNPVHVLGMIYVLETLAFVYGGRIAQSVSASMGRKVDQGFNFLDSHAKLDEDHTEKLNHLFLMLDQTQHLILLNSISTNFYLFKNIIGFKKKGVEQPICDAKQMNDQFVAA